MLFARVTSECQLKGVVGNSLVYVISSMLVRGVGSAEALTDFRVQTSFRPRGVIAPFDLGCCPDCNYVQHRLCNGLRIGSDLELVASCFSTMNLARRCSRG